MKSRNYKIMIVILLMLPFLAGLKPGEFNEAEFINYLKEMHANIYKTFEYNDDSEIYNCLAYSFADDELETQFFEFLKTIREFEEQGYKNYIENIDYEKIIIEKRTGKLIKVYMKWKVFGLVKHLLHEHNRINMYEAIYKLEKSKDDEDWKIVNTQILNSERIIFPRRYYNQPNIQIGEEPIRETINSPL